MQLFTYGPIHVSAVRVETEINLTGLRERLAEQLYTNEPPNRGWAALPWQDEAEEAPRIRRDSVGAPNVFDIADRRVLCARLFIDREDTTLRRRVGDATFEDFSAQTQNQLDAIDTIAVADGGGLVVFVATADPVDAGTVTARLNRAAGRDTWNMTPLPELARSTDLYLWMLYRYGKQMGALCDDVSLVEFRTLSGTDSEGRPTRQLQGVGIDRKETLGAVAEGDQLGPAKFAVYDSTVGLTADLFLLDGSFDVHRQKTEYDGDLVDKAQLGIRSTLDVGTVILPKIHAAHRADKVWHQTLRAQFREECKTTMRQRFS